MAADGDTSMSVAPASDVGVAASFAPAHAAGNDLSVAVTSAGHAVQMSGASASDGTGAMVSHDYELPSLRCVKVSSGSMADFIASSLLSAGDWALWSRLSPHEVSDIKYRPNATAPPKLHKRAKWISLDLVMTNAHQVPLHLVEKRGPRGPTYPLLLKSSDWSKEAVILKDVRAALDALGAAPALNEATTSLPRVPAVSASAPGHDSSTIKASEKQLRDDTDTTRVAELTIECAAVGRSKSTESEVTRLREDRDDLQHKFGIAKMESDLQNLKLVDAQGSAFERLLDRDVI